MKLKTKTIVVRDETFEVRELTIKEMMPLMTALQEDPELGQIKLIEEAVTQNGNPITNIGNFPAGAFMQLANAVMEVNELGDDTGNA